MKVSKREQKLGNIFYRGFTRFLGGEMFKFYGTYGLPIEFQFDYLLENGSNNKLRSLLVEYYTQGTTKEESMRVVRSFSEKRVQSVRSLIELLSSNVCI